MYYNDLEDRQKGAGFGRSTGARSGVISHAHREFDGWFAVRSLVGALETYLEDRDDEDALVALDFALDAVKRALGLMEAA